MAFEDRCSPQSAPSPPPGIPHSPQNTAMISNSNESDLNNSNSSSFSTDQEMSMPISVQRNAHTISSASPSLLCVKAEKMENHTIDHQNVTPITFSITNILSNCFGNKSPTTTQMHPRKTISEKKSNLLFRPYDDNLSAMAKRKNVRNSHIESDDEEEIEVTDPIVQETARTQNGAIDFSNHRNVQQNLHAITTHPLHPQLQHLSNNNIYANFYQTNQFPPAALSIYPKIHDDILNSTKKYQQYYQTTDNILSKYPPLGNLCKTVSQIGQSIPTISTKHTLPAAATLSPQKKYNGRELADMSVSLQRSEATSSAGTSPVKESTTKAQQSNSLDSGMESSDDTKSETGSTKDENGSQQWPAWIYCTRYSDRPSSGKLKYYLFFFVCVIFTKFC